MIPSHDQIELIRQIVQHEARDIVRDEVDAIVGDRTKSALPDLDLSLESFKENVRTELGMILRVWGPANIRTYVQQKVEKSAFDLVMSMIGFEHSFGRWQVKSSSVTNEAMKFIMDAARETIQEWFQQQLGDLPDLPETAKKSILKEYREHYESELRKMMRDEATRQARLTMGRMVAQINGEDKA